MLPNLLVIGAQKCGTSSLHSYLGLHPDIAMSNPKELNFFLAKGELGGMSYGTWERGLEWYRSRFPQDTPVRGESSPNYSTYPLVKEVPQRAASVVPDARLIFMVRDPIERIVSQHVHRVSAGQEQRSLDETLRGIARGHGVGYVLRSSYHMQIQHWLEHYPRERLLVVAQEDLRDDRVGVLRRVFRFLEVDESFGAGEVPVVGQNRSSDKRTITGPVRGASRVTRRLPRRLGRAVDRQLANAFGEPIERPELPAAQRRWLEEVLRQDVERLRSFTGQSFDAWSL